VTNIKHLSDRKTSKPATSRGEYTPPRLKEFGPVGALTQAGTGLTAEMGSGKPGVKSMA
jgi:hypothetical protein